MWRRFLFFLLILAVVCAFSAEAELEGGSAVILERMARKISESEGMGFRARVIVDEVSPDGQRLQFEQSIRVLVHRPTGGVQGFWYELTGPRGTLRAWFDGARFTLFDKEKNVYATSPIRGGIDSALMTAASRLGVALPLSDFMLKGVFNALTTGAESVRYVGRSRVGEWDCSHIAFEGRGIDWQLWVDEGARPLPRKVVITSKGAPPGRPQMTTQMTALFTKWSLGAELSPSLFIFTPPDGAVEAEFMPQGNREGNGNGNGSGSETEGGGE